MKILCVGQSAYDITLPVKEYPKENRKMKINKAYSCGGGSSNNAAYLLGLWGSDVSLASTIGNDSFGKKIKEELDSVHVDLSYFEELLVHTTVSYIVSNEANGSRTIITNKDDKMHFSSDFNIHDNFDYLFFDGNDSDLSKKVLLNNPKAISIIDAGSLKDGVRELCQMVNYVLCSNDFAREYTGLDFSYDNFDSIVNIYEEMKKTIPGKLVITLEENGCFTKINNEYKIIPSIKVNSIDSTGAGDIFHGAFTYFISHNYDFEKSLRLANIAGALSVTKIGSKNSMPELKEVLKYGDF